MAEEFTKKQQKEVEKEVEKQVEKRLKIYEKLLKEGHVFRSEFKKEASTAIIAAFGFLIALSWKDFVTKIAENLQGTGIMVRYPYLAELYVAVIITAFSVIGIMLISRWAKKEDKNK